MSIQIIVPTTRPKLHAAATSTVVLPIHIGKPATARVIRSIEQDLQYSWIHGKPSDGGYMGRYDVPLSTTKVFKFPIFRHAYCARAVVLVILQVPNCEVQDQHTKRRITGR